MVMKFIKSQLVGKNDLVSLAHVNELIKGLNKKQEIEEESKKNTWLIVLALVVGIGVVGLVVYKLFFVGDDFDEFDDFDDDFEDMDFDDEYDDFDDFEDNYDVEFEEEIDEIIDTVSDEQ